MKFSKAGATLPPECNTEPLAGFQSVNFRLKTATSALISISSLLACSKDFGLASPTTAGANPLNETSLCIYSVGSVSLGNPD